MNTTPSRLSRLARPLALSIAAVSIAAAGYAAGAAGKAEPRFFELRTYVSPAGKMPALQARFRNHTNRLFTKHGMQPLAYWQAVSGENAENTLVYVLAYPSKEAREASWKAFGSDPEWTKAKAESEKDGKLVEKVISTYMTPTDFSAVR
jgi:hypothetical protein